MAEQVFPTKGNLLNTKRALQLSQLGYELLDRKRNILIREMMLLIDQAKSLHGSIENTYQQAYQALQYANITLGFIDNIAQAIPIETSLKLSSRSVMGVELPRISMDSPKPQLNYGMARTNFELDMAYLSFCHVKEMTVTLAEIENSIYRLAISIKKTQSRANALKNVRIPRFQEIIKYITNSLEEKEREEFSRMKVIKMQKRQK